MTFSLIDISDIENRLIVDAKDKYCKVFENAENMVYLTWSFLKSAEIDSWIFISFVSQVQKFAILSLLSTIRQHNA